MRNGFNRTLREIESATAATGVETRCAVQSLAGRTLTEQEATVIQANGCRFKPPQQPFHGWFRLQATRADGHGRGEVAESGFPITDIDRLSTARLENQGSRVSVYGQRQKIVNRDSK